MIVKDEEKYIARCLESVSSSFNNPDIIVVDTGSIDKTKEVAKNFTNNIFDYKWDNDFSSARNFSISKAAYD
jgi:glycosyltransferase involved in cell wall biosynthesis